MNQKESAVLIFSLYRHQGLATYICGPHQCASKAALIASTMEADADVLKYSTIQSDVTDTLMLEHRKVTDTLTLGRDDVTDTSTLEHVDITDTLTPVHHNFVDTLTLGSEVATENLKMSGTPVELSAEMSTHQLNSRCAVCNAKFPYRKRGCRRYGVYALLRVKYPKFYRNGSYVCQACRGYIKRKNLRADPSSVSPLLLEMRKIIHNSNNDKINTTEGDENNDENGEDDKSDRDLVVETAIPSALPNTASVDATSRAEDVILTEEMGVDHSYDCTQRICYECAKAKDHRYFQHYGYCTHVRDKHYRYYTHGRSSM